VREQTKYIAIGDDQAAFYPILPLPRGLGVQKNYRLAKTYLTTGANEGDAEAIALLAMVRTCVAGAYTSPHFRLTSSTFWAIGWVFHGFSDENGSG